MIGNVQLPAILSTALSPVLGYIQEKNRQVLECLLTSFLSFHFDSTAVELYENTLFVFIFRFWAYLSTHINVTSCHEATNTTSKGSWSHAFFTPASLPLWCPLSGHCRALIRSGTRPRGNFNLQLKEMTFCGEAALSST